MKKLFIVIIVFVVCLGLGKKECSAFNFDTDIISKIAVVKLEKDLTNSFNNKTNSILGPIKKLIKESFNNSKTWYDENKDYIKEEAIRSLNDDKETAKEIYSKAKTWYDENKDNIKENAKEKYNEGKSIIKSLFNKFKISE